MKPDIRCRWCLRWHPPTLLCPTAAAMLKSLGEDMDAKAAGLTIPSMKFDKPVIGGLGEQEHGDAFCQQIVVMGAVFNMDTTAVPALVFTGQDSTGRPLPRWIFPGDDGLMDATVALVRDQAETAKDAARQAREGT